MTSPKRRLVYLTAIYTGLRLGELRQLVKDDLHLDEDRPYVAARASTTKNRKEAVIPPHPALTAELRIATREHGTADKVVRLSPRISRTFRADLLRAKIEPVDALGRKLDFHALRKTFATRLAQKGVAQRLTQELMRHQDANLTAQNYTDATLLPTSAPAPYTHIDTQNPVPDGHLLAHNGNGNGKLNPQKTPANKGQCHALAGAVTKGQMAERGGFEPPVGC